MNDKRVEHHTLRPLNYELFIIAISLTVLINLVLTWMPGTDETVDRVISAFNVGLGLILLGDFLNRMYHAPSRSNYFLRGGGWLDLLGSIPFLPFALLRLYRLVWTIRELDKLGERQLLNELADFRTGSAFYLIIFLGIILLEFASASIVDIESGDPSANITTAGDAIWWAYVTATTVGYGDYFPVTQGGRYVGVLVMTVGVALFTGLTGFLANSFFGDRERAATRLQRRLEQSESGIPPVVADVREFRRLLNEQQRANQRLQSRLDEIERFLLTHGDNIAPNEDDGS